MTSYSADERPICRKILQIKNSWSLKAEDFIDFKEFDEISLDYLRKFRGSQTLLYKFSLRKIAANFHFITSH
jgi:hypothetical protein